MSPNQVRFSTDAMLPVCLWSSSEKNFEMAVTLLTDKSFFRVWTCFRGVSRSLITTPRVPALGRSVLLYVVYIRFGQ